MLIIHDVDGTLLNNEQRVDLIPADRGPTANWDEFNAAHVSDSPIRYRFDYLNVLAMNHEVVYMTSRSERFIETTRHQLSFHSAPFGKLVMRKADDNRTAAQFKLEAIRHELELRKIDDGYFILIDDDLFVCHCIAEHYPNAKIIKVPSQCCAYLQQASNLVTA